MDFKTNKRYKFFDVMKSFSEINKSYKNLDDFKDLGYWLPLPVQPNNKTVKELVNDYGFVYASADIWSVPTLVHCVDGNLQTYCITVGDIKGRTYWYYVGESLTDLNKDDIVVADEHYETIFPATLTMDDIFASTDEYHVRSYDFVDVLDVLRDTEDEDKFGFWWADSLPHFKDYSIEHLMLNPIMYDDGGLVYDNYEGTIEYRPSTYDVSGISRWYFLGTDVDALSECKNVIHTDYTFAEILDNGIVGE